MRTIQALLDHVVEGLENVPDVGVLVVADDPDPKTLQQRPEANQLRSDALRGLRRKRIPD